MAKGGKYLKKKKRSFGFVIGMVVYAVLFLTAAGFGLRYLWDFMDAYEASRPENTVNAYMAQLTPDYICDSAQDLIDQIDHNIQSEENCRQAIRDAVSDGVTFARKSAECTDTLNVYVLRSGGKVIGQVELIPQGEERYGFTPWVVSSDSFDLSFLIGETASITVVNDFNVYVDGQKLDESYVTEKDIKFETMEEFYGEFNLPTMTTYTAGPRLGTTEFTVTDADGNPVVIDENTDLRSFLNNCPEDLHQELETFAADFITHYARYLSSRRETYWANYTTVIKYVVPDSDLADRLYNAMEGLYFGQSTSDVISSITVNCLTELGDRYFCDITYEVDSEGNEGIYHSVNNAKFIILRTQNGLKVEMLMSY